MNVLRKIIDERKNIKNYTQTMFFVKSIKDCDNVPNGSMVYDHETNSMYYIDKSNGKKTFIELFA